MQFYIARVKHGFHVCEKTHYLAERVELSSGFAAVDNLENDSDYIYFSEPILFERK